MLRDYLVQQKIHLARSARVLEVGCGTGAVLAEIQKYLDNPIHGIEYNVARARESRRNVPQALLTAGDALHLPYADAAFDVTYCHFFLLWIKEPRLALQEMRRVTRRGGYVLLLAEPDYAARIDYPDTYRALGAAQRAALKHHGANPDIGRHIPELCEEAGLKLLESGILGAQWQQPPDPVAWHSEWEVIQADLSDRMSSQTLDDLKIKDWQDRVDGRRVLFVPVFYVLAQV